MRKWVIPVIAISAIVLSTCSQTPVEESKYITVELENVKVQKNFNDLPHVNVGSVEAIQASQFVLTTDELPVETDNDGNRLYELYGYRFIGSDGFYAHKKGSPDNIWPQLEHGYIDVSTRDVFWDSTLGLPTRYNVRDVDTLKLVRQFWVIADTDSVQVPIDDCDTVTVEDTLCVPLVSILEASDTTFVLDSAATYTLQAIDGYSKEVTGAQLATGYWNTVSRKVKFIPDIGSAYRIKFLYAILRPAR